MLRMPNIRPYLLNKLWNMFLGLCWLMIGQPEMCYRGKQRLWVLLTLKTSHLLWEIGLSRSKLLSLIYLQCLSRTLSHFLIYSQAGQAMI